MSIAEELGAELRRQDELWPGQNRSPIQWLAILTEEVGEVAQEVANAIDHPPIRANYRVELIQVAAVAVQAIRAYDRRYPPAPARDFMLDN